MKTHGLEIFIFLENSSLCSNFLEGDFLAKKKGEQYKCDECGLVVLVENPCDCGEGCELVCCDVPMKPVKAPAKPKK